MKLACWLLHCHFGPVLLPNLSADFSFFPWNERDIAISRNILIKQLNLLEGDGFKLRKLIKTVICKHFPQTITFCANDKSPWTQTLRAPARSVGMIWCEMVSQGKPSTLDFLDMVAIFCFNYRLESHLKLKER